MSQVSDSEGFVVASREAGNMLSAAARYPARPGGRMNPAAYTGAHLPRLPRPPRRPRDVWAECVFTNPVADLAVLARPDDQELSGRAAAYDHLIQAAKRFAVGSLQIPRRQRGLPGNPASSDARITISGLDTK